jgi:Flp pilus assembly protein TadG
MSFVGRSFEILKLALTEMEGAQLRRYTMPTLSLSRNSFAKAVHPLGRLRADQRGNVAVMMGFLLPILCGAVGLGFEVTNWYMQTRAMQNAADSAALAAASNGSSSYNVEADAVAATYGYVSGAKNVTVTALNGVTCPDGTAACYSVQISGMVPLYVSQVIGYSGDLTVAGQKMKAVSSTAMAERTLTPQVVCLLALNTTGTALQGNGSPKTDFSGCTLVSNANATCNGSNLLANMGIAVGSNGGGAGCGLQQISNYPTPLPDPYSQILNSDTGMSAAALAKCNNNFPQYTKKNGYPTQISKVSDLISFTDPNDSGNTVYVACGDTQLSANITLPAGKNSVVVVENGVLDLGGMTLSGTSSSLVFSGTNTGAGSSSSHYPTDLKTGGTLDIQAPTSGNWSGVALYQDPTLTKGLDFQYNGNNPTWNLTGLVYLPYANVQMSGAINKSANGADCMVTVIGSVLINGTGSIYAQTPDGSGCKAAHLLQPTVTIPSRSKLVY